MTTVILEVKLEIDTDDKDFIPLIIQEMDYKFSYDMGKYAAHEAIVKTQINDYTIK